MLEPGELIEMPGQSSEVNVEEKPKAKPRKARSTARGLKVKAVFSDPKVSPYEQIQWDKRTAQITGDKGEVIFEQNGVEVPKDWSMLATNIVASKYFYGAQNSDEREYSVGQLVHRVARTIADWGKSDGYFASDADVETFYNELSFLCLNQYGSFNSPVWFNCGLYHQYEVGKGSSKGNFCWNPKTDSIMRASTQYEYPQCSACFIQCVGDSMEEIMELARAEAMLFKYGSGSGSDLSTLRSTREKLSGGGIPSGPLSFLRVYDSIAGVIKSGGKTRRAAKMNTLKITHPDIKEFIEAKTLEEKKAWALIDGGYDGSFNGEAYASIAFQNENLSIRVTDDFMHAVDADQEWQTHWVTDPSKKGPVYKARDLMRWMAEGTWVCGDPGIQYADIIGRWHTCKESGEINSSNPCSEYMFLDNSACNLASLNLMKFMTEDQTFEIERFKSAAEIFITAQEIIVDNASYPTEGIAENSHNYRPLGLGYANLGSLVMALGHPYGSDGGRAWAGAITGLMHFHAYTQSAKIAGVKGPFAGYEPNRECMLDVVRGHQKELSKVSAAAPHDIMAAAYQCADEAIKLGEKNGYRNAQVTLLAPTGTIGFMMDCDTTGVEPDIALVKYKALAGGGLLKIVNQTVPKALQSLSYDVNEAAGILAFIEEHDTIEGAPALKEEHLAVFDCAFKPRNGERSISYKDHIKMMAAVQPFLSGAISKTVNMPHDATVEEIMETYMEGWRLGLKSIAIYRDGCKRSQPLNTSHEDATADGTLKPEPVKIEARPLRRRMPQTRNSLTHKFDIAGHEGYLTVGLYEDGQPGELFITMAKEGSTIGGLMDGFGTAISMCLQYGVPLKTLSDKFAHSRFEPSGFTSNPDIPMAKSLMDYIFRWMAHTFLEGHAPVPPPNIALNSAAAAVDAVAADSSGNDRVDDQFKGFMEDAPVCDNCGAITVRNGACYRCFNCGNSLGCS